MNNVITKLSPSEQLEILSSRQTGAPAFSEKMYETGLFPLKPYTIGDSPN